jgi:hypothetical protein
MSDVLNNSEPEPSPREPAGDQALEVDLRVAVMACLSRGESRPWTRRGTGRALMLWVWLSRIRPAGGDPKSQWWPLLAVERGRQ